ncbi:hypothetical protein Tco_0716309 [Tanacetum coccineum]
MFKNRSWRGINPSGIKSCALRNFDLEVMELENSQNNALAKLPMLKLGEYEMWEIRIKIVFSKSMGLCSMEVKIHLTATKMTVPSSMMERRGKKNEGKRQGSLPAHGNCPTEHQLTVRPASKACASSTNNINTVNPEVSTGTTKVNTASTEIKYCSFSDAAACEARKFFLRNWKEKSSLMEANTVDMINQRLEDASEMAMCDIDGVDLIGVTWHRKEIQAKHGSHGILSFWYDDLLVKLDYSGFKAATYKRGHKEYHMGLLRDELEKVKQEKEGFEFKIAKFDKSAKDLSLENSKNPESSLKVKNKDGKVKKVFLFLLIMLRKLKPKKVRENNDAPIIEDWVFELMRMMMKPNP